MKNHYDEKTLYKKSKSRISTKKTKLRFLDIKENKEKFVEKILVSYDRLQNPSKIIAIFLGLVISLLILNSIINMIISLIAICIVLSSIYIFYKR